MSVVCALILLALSSSWLAEIVFFMPYTLVQLHFLYSSLKGSDVFLVVSACEFLSDVVFEDFSAEVFLQRPSIVKVLVITY